MRARAAVVLNRRSVGAARAPCIIVLRALPSGSRAARPSRDEERGEVRPPLSLSRFLVLVECTRTNMYHRAALDAHWNGAVFAVGPT